MRRVVLLEGWPGRQWGEAVRCSGTPTHQSVIAFDVEGFSDPYRDDSAQAAISAAARDYYQRTEALLTELGNPGVDRVRAQLAALGPP